MHAIKTVGKHLVCIVILLTSALCAAETIRVFTWRGYFVDQVIADFQKRTGHKIVFDYFGSDLERDAVLYKEYKEFDLVVMESDVLATYKTTGILQRLDFSRLANFDNLDPRWRDGCADLGVPYFWGGVGIAYRASLVQQPITSWQQLLEPDESLQGRIVMLDSTIDVLVPALKMLGHSANSTDIAHLKQAYELLKMQRPHVMEYAYSLDVVEGRAKAQQMLMAEAYTGDHATLAEITGDQDWKFVYPQEGTSLWLDCLSVKESSGDRKAVMQFLDYLLTPEVAARQSEGLGIPTANRAAYELLSEGFRNDPAVYIPAPILEKSERQKIPPANIQTMRNKILLALDKKK